MLNCSLLEFNIYQAGGIPRVKRLLNLLDYSLLEFSMYALPSIANLGGVGKSL